MPYRLRFSLGQLMGLIALCAPHGECDFHQPGQLCVSLFVLCGLELCWNRRAIPQSSALEMDLGLDRRYGVATPRVGQRVAGIRAAEALALFP